jgi:hypothetical protein
MFVLSLHLHIYIFTDKNIMAAKNPHNLPLERVDLPSKGLVYPESNLLSQGFIEILPPGARQEDILTNGNYLDKGNAVDKYLESILVTDVALDDMIPGDKDGFMLAARVLGLGKTYTTQVRLDGKNEIVSFDLTSFKERENWVTLEGKDYVCPNGTIFAKGLNEFSYNLPEGKASIKFKLLTGKDQVELEAEESGMRKASPDYSADTSLFLKFSIIEVNGSRATGDIRKFVDNPRELPQYMIKELKKYIISVSPGYIWKADGVKANKEIVEDLPVPYTVDFFWPRY